MAGPRAGMVDFLCIGAQKAGTTWLWEALRRHPGVFSPPIKELHHYDHRHVPANRAWTGLHLRRAVRRALRWHVNHAAPFDRAWIDYLIDLAEREPFTPAWYARAFARAPAGAVRVDITPEYAGLPPEGVAEVLADNPGVRVLHILRDPVDRALSQIRMGFAQAKVSAPDDAAWRAALAGADLAERSDYARHIAVWDRAAPGRVRRVAFEELAADPAAFLGRVERFAGLSPGPRPTGLAAPVHGSAPMSVPDWVRAALEDRLAPQRAAMAAALR